MGHFQQIWALSNALKCPFTAMYYNGEFYHKIEVLPNLGKSDHVALLCKPNQNAKYDKGQKCTKQIRVSGNNEKALFVKNLKEINWTGLYRLNSCEEQFLFFDQIMTSLIETHFPLKTITTHSKDKPWITQDFKKISKSKAICEKNRG